MSGSIVGTMCGQAKVYLNISRRSVPEEEQVGRMHIALMHDSSRKPVLVAVQDKDAEEGIDSRSCNKVGTGSAGYRLQTQRPLSIRHSFPFPPD